MLSVYEILLAEYETTWGVRKTGNKDRLRDLGTLFTVWRPNSPWKSRSWKTSSAFTAECIFRGSQKSMKKRQRQLAWDSKRLSIRKDDEHPVAIKRMKARRLLRARVTSRGRDMTTSIQEALEWLADNTLYIESEGEDQPSIHAAVWFEQTQTDWQPQACFISGVGNPAEHPLLYPFFGIHQATSPDRGLRGLVFHSEPQYIESTVATLASEAMPPILQGSHFYLPFTFGKNLQAAVQCSTPLVLVSDLPNGRRWRSTPFDLQFANIRLSDCVLFVMTQTLDEIFHTTCYLFAMGPDDRRYFTELGGDDSTLRWNLYLNKALKFEPPSVYDTDSELNRSLAGQDDDFYRTSDQPFPPLGAADVYDGWLGSKAWRDGAIPGVIYESLKDAQLVHLQFGTALPTLGMTDAALVFRGTPGTKGTDGNFEYQRCLFRVVAGQPFNPELTRITHEAQMRMTIFGYACEGYFEPGTAGLILNLRPVSDFDIRGFAGKFEVEIPLVLWPAVDQFSLLLNLQDMKGWMYASNGLDYELAVAVGDT